MRESPSSRRYDSYRSPYLTGFRSLVIIQAPNVAAYLLYSWAFDVVGLEGEKESGTCGD